VTRAFTGLPARVLRNRFQQEYEEANAPVLPGLLQSALEQPIWQATTRQHNADYFPLYAGQSVGVIRDLPSAADVVRTIIEEARRITRGLEADGWGLDMDRRV
jgi:NAD(P)H-dependent flavin oxidoreductase YrpB (nitropropane dioxygenase family)